MRELAVSFWGVHPNIALTDWITDRLPTAADGDQDGEVLVRQALEDFGTHVRWDYLAEGAPWRHAASWEPPVPAAEKPALALGQTWRTREGQSVTINKHDHDSETSYPFRAGSHWYTFDGMSCIGDSDADLVELISEAPKLSPIPRWFASITRTIEPHSGAHILDAVDMDGTAWWMRLDNTGDEYDTWQQLRPLPPKEAH